MPPTKHLPPRTGMPRRQSQARPQRLLYGQFEMLQQRVFPVWRAAEALRTALATLQDALAHGSHHHFNTLVVTTRQVKKAATALKTGLESVLTRVDPLDMPLVWSELMSMDLQAILRDLIAVCGWRLGQAGVSLAGKDARLEVPVDGGVYADAFDRGQEACQETGSYLRYAQRLLDRIAHEAHVHQLPALAFEAALSARVHAPVATTRPPPPLETEGQWDFGLDHLYHMTQGTRPA